MVSQILQYGFLRHIFLAIIIFSFFASTVFFIVVRVHAEELNYIADTTIVVNGMNFTIKNGSKATRIVINSATASFTVPAASSLTVESSAGMQLSTTSDIAQNCSDQGGTLKNSLTIEGERTFTIDPQNISCKQAATGRYGSGTAVAVVVVSPPSSAQPATPAAAPSAPPTPAQQIVVDAAKIKADEAAAAAAEAAKKAEEARLAAQDARKKADEAMTAVDQAKLKVQTATSAEAKQQVEEAVLAALQALKKADEATVKAGLAKKKADEVAITAKLAKERSDQAGVLATDAQKKAAEVVEFSKEVKSIADDAGRTALGAKVKAEQAVSTAYSAQQEVVVTERKVQETQKAAEEITEKRPELVKQIKARLEADAFKQQLVDIKQEAKKEITAEADVAAQAIGIERNANLEKQLKPLVERVIEKAEVKELPKQAKAKIENFVTYGTKLTEEIGAGERAGVVRSFQVACGKLPTTEKDWENVLRIANGRFPDAKECTATKERTITNFEVVYKREPNLKSPNDSAAVNVMQFGLLPKKRNVKSEQRSIAIFKGIYGYAPRSATAWNVVRAIAYSGAKR